MQQAYTKFVFSVTATTGLSSPMRPVFAIAPLALAMALWGPTTQARSGDQSWTTAFIDWVFARHTMTSLPEKAASTPTFKAPFRAAENP